ncbi:MAG: alginate export family protein [Acidobacteria bacterium]|nr:alginate export family protein [Acidobacteriota bacterium]
MRKRASIGATLALWLLASGSRSSAQNQPSTPLTIAGIHFSGSLRVRPEVWDWFDTSAAEPNYTYFASLLRLTFSQERPRWDWQVEFAQPLLLGLPENSVASPPQGQLGLGASYFAANHDSTAAYFFAKQGFVRLKAIFGDQASSLRFGRFEFVDGAEVAPKDTTLSVLKRDRIAHRLLGNFGFSHVGRSFDGIQYVRATPGMNVTLLIARATQGVFQVNGWGELDTDVMYGAVTRSVGKKSPGEWRVFALSYHDGRPVLKVDNRPVSARNADQHNIRITSLGGNYLQTLNTEWGTADLLFWGTWQVGSWGVLDHHAGAIAIEGGFQPVWKLKPWFRGGYFYSTGDDNPADGQHGTFFQVLPTPRIYARFPFYNLMNNQDAFAEVILRPHPKWTIRSDAHFLRLGNKNDLWYSGGGAFQSSTFGFVGRPSGGIRSLANVYDANADYQVNPHVTLTGYYAVATGRAVIQKIYPDGGTGQFGYGELSWKF